MEFVIAIICMLVWGAIKAGKENVKEEQKKAQELKKPNLLMKLHWLN